MIIAGCMQKGRITNFFIDNLKKKKLRFSMEIGINYSSETFQIALQLLDATDDLQISGLELLSNLFVYGNAQLLVNFPISSASKKLIEILFTAEDKKILNLTSLCIQQFLEALPNSVSALLKNNLLFTISEYFQINDDKKDEKTVANLIKALYSISEYKPSYIGENFGIHPILKVFNLLQENNKKSAIQTIQRITDSYADSTFIPSLMPLIDLFNYQNEIISSAAMLSVGNIIRKIEKNKLESIPVQVIPKLINTINHINSGSCAVSLLLSLTSLSTFDIFGESILENPINYQRLIFEVDFQGNTEEVKKLILNIVVNLLPDTELPNEYWKRNNRTLKGTPKFAKDIQDLLVKIILSKTGFEALTLAALSATMIEVPLEPNDDLINALAGLVQTPLFAPFVLLFVIHLSDPSIIVKAGILHFFQTITPDNDDIKDWYQQTLASLMTKLGPLATQTTEKVNNFQDFQSLCEYVVNNKELNSYQFQLNTTQKQAFNFLSDISNSKNFTIFNNSLVIQAINKMVNLTLGLLTYLPIPRMRDPLEDYSPHELLTKTEACTVKTPEEDNVEITVGLDLDFSGLEAWYNSRRDRVSGDKMIEALNNSEYKDIIILENPDEMYFTQKGLLYRALKLPQMKKYSFKIGDNIFSAYDSVFQSVVRSIHISNQFKEKIHIEFIEGDCPRAKLIPQLNIHEETLFSLRFLELIHQLLPSINLYSKAFNTRILSQISSPLLTIGLLSPSSQILYHFPFLFSYELRQTLFKIIGLDISYSLPFMNYFFFKVPFNGRTNFMRLKCHIRRDNLFEDGMKMLKAVGPGMLRIDVFFDGEEGIGAGPTQEFFALFSKELCKKKYGLFRFDSTDDSEYCFSEKGLFPQPNAPPEMFYIFGLLCAKAILMDMVLSIPLNPAFFKTIRGEKTTLDEIDPIMAKSLQTPEGLLGLDFTYPGLPDYELIHNGKNKIVTKQNVSEYVKLVIDTTLNLSKITESFKRGFSTIIQYEALNLFTAQEVCSLIEGQEPIPLTEEMLRENIIVSHGYTNNSPQIKYLIDILTEFNQQERGIFFKFITGCDKLPVGGITALKPKLTVAVRAPMKNQSPDDSLPSVLTCVNYLKIPKYSTKAIMKEKLMIAIKEGQGHFLLT